MGWWGWWRGRVEASVVKETAARAAVVERVAWRGVVEAVAGAVHAHAHAHAHAHLLLDLRDHAEDVAVVLLEAAHAREAREGTRQLVAVQHAKVAVPARGGTPL